MKRWIVAAALCAAAGSVSGGGLNWIDGGLPVALYEPGFFERDSARAVSDLALTGFLHGRDFPASISIANMNVAPVDSSLTFACMSARSTSSPASEYSYDPSKDLPSQVQTVKNDPIYYGGEVGFYYGSTIGSKWKGDQWGSYLIGGVGNEHFQITVGASYEESSFRIPARVIR